MTWWLAQEATQLKQLEIQSLILIELQRLNLEVERIRRKLPPPAPEFTIQYVSERKHPTMATSIIKFNLKVKAAKSLDVTKRVLVLTGPGLERTHEESGAGEFAVEGLELPQDAVLHVHATAYDDGDNFSVAEADIVVLDKVAPDAPEFEIESVGERFVEVWPEPAPEPTPEPEPAPEPTE